MEDKVNEIQTGKVTQVWKMRHKHGDDLDP